MGKHTKFLIEKIKENNAIVKAMFALTRTDIIAFICYYVVLQNLISMVFVNKLFILSTGIILLDFVIMVITLPIVYLSKENYVVNLKYAVYAFFGIVLFQIISDVITNVTSAPIIDVSSDEGALLFFGFDIFTIVMFAVIYFVVFGQRRRGLF